MFFSFSTIISLILAYKYLLLFPIAIIEGPIVTVIAGFLSSMGYLNIFLVYAVVVAGDVTGDILYYSIGKKGGKAALTKIGKWLGITEEKVGTIKQRFHDHSKKTLLLGKLTHAFGSVILFTAGMVSLDFWEFVWVNTLGTAVKSLILVVIGYYFGQAYVTIDKYFNRAVIFIVIAGILLLAAWFAAQQINKKYFKK